MSSKFSNKYIELAKKMMTAKTSNIRLKDKLGSNKAPNLVGLRIQFVRLKIFIIWFKRWSFSINKFTFKSPVIIIRGDDSNALSIEMLSNDSSIICVTESHLDENILTTDIKLPGYHEPFRNDRNCFGGGVLVYTADYLHVLRRNDLEFNGGELIWLEVIFPRFKILVCAVYRSPGAVNSFWENFHISIERAFESPPRFTTSVLFAKESLRHSKLLT
jgi:hypothetical protein